MGEAGGDTCRVDRRKRKVGIQITILAGLLCFLYSSCYAQMKEMRECIMEKLLRETLECAAGMNASLPEPSAVLTCVPEEVIVQDGTFSYGNLKVTLDSGVAVQIDETSENETVIALPGASCEEEEAILPPRITLSHYHAEYASEKALICAILEEIPESEILHRYYWNHGNRMYSYYFTDDGCFAYYVLVYGEELYLLGEIQMEEDYSVSHLLDASAIAWKDGGETVRFWNEPTGKYSVIDEKEVRFLVENCTSGNRSAYMDETNFYMRGCYEEPYQTMPMSFYRNAFRDFNFDGYPDLTMSGSEGVAKYLWSPQERIFKPAYLNIGEYSFDGDSSEMYPETQMILLTHGLYDEEWGWRGCAECICKWQGEELVILRECYLHVEEDGVRVYAYEEDAGSLLFDETFERELWEADESVARPLYERFYDGLVPKEEVWGRNHDAEAETEAGTPHIPQEFLDILSDSLKSDTVLEVLSPMVNDEAVEREALLDIAKENLQLRLELEAEEMYGGGGLALKADLDNDGRKDLYLEIANGGSSGGTEATFFKGQADGTYERTCRNPQWQEEIAVLSYEGQNYLCRTSYDYGLKQVDGLRVFCYEEGVPVEEVCLKMVPASCDVQVAECSDNAYRELANAIAEKGEFIRERISEYEIIVGAAEQECETEDGKEYLCDLDNDGVEESYEKDIWLCSNYYTSDMLDFGVDEWEEDHIAKVIYGGDDTPLMMWAEPADGKNIVNVLYVTGLWDYEIVGYLFEGTEEKEVYRIDGIVHYGVEQTRTGIDETYNSDPWVGV